ncbi:MAG TPA: methyltransferase domain-containing protein [Bryobacteraceae bacterium]|nr:methyltransferase domain-containing protein [Bryobacteraceae bacterium]
MAEWNPQTYMRFASERTRPSVDLALQVALENPRRIIDLGCGPGNSTEVVRRRWPNAKVIGLDSSPHMIEEARKKWPEEEWLVEDASAWIADEPFDIVFSNAMLQWLPDHAPVCRRLMGQVAPGGALAVQMPAHYELPMHREIVEVSQDPAWSDRMHGARAALTREPASFYYDVLQPLTTRLDLWETVYYHEVPGPDALVEWFRGTGMRPFLEALANEDERARFEMMLLRRYMASYPRRASGLVLFPFRRLFFVAYR